MKEAGAPVEGTVPSWAKGGGCRGCADEARSGVVSGEWGSNPG